MSIDWTVLEVEIIIADYFKMLHQELEKEKYNKTSHRGLILPMLNNRSEGSVEFKHQNISAVLAEMGVPFIKGYKPRFNYQQLLADEVIKYISNNKQVLEPSFEKFSNDIVIAQPKSLDFERFLDDEPSNSVVNEIEPTFKPIKINYLEKEQNNRR